MKQVEFEQTMREMKRQKAEALRPLQVMINDIKEKQAAKRRLMHELSEQIGKLEQERQQIAGRLSDVAAEWNKRINDFFRDNFTESRELGEVSDWTLIRELNKRGFRGWLDNHDRTDEMVANANQKLNADTHSDDEEKTETE